MVAFAQVSVPIFTVLMRRSFGVAGNNYATPTRGGLGARGVAGGRRRRHPAGGRHRGGVQAPARRGGRSRRAARRDQRPHRERARPDRPAQPVPDRGDDRPARHPPAGLRVGRRRLPDRRASPRGWCRARCSSGLRSTGVPTAALAISTFPAISATESRRPFRNSFPPLWEPGEGLPARLGGFRGFPGRNSSEGVSALSATRDSAGDGVAEISSRSASEGVCAVSATNSPIA